MRRAAARRRAAWWWSAAALALILAAGAAWWVRPWEAPAAVQADAPVTAAVERTTLTSQLRLGAQLSYGDAAPLPGAAGIITVLPAAGATVETGNRVYEVDGRPVVLFRGERPFWRELAAGAKGEDVRQLQQNLADLGFYTGRADGGFGAATRQAVRAWQKSLGVEQNGVFSPSDVVVADAAGIRIAQITARLGDSGTSPATYTETSLRATARLTAAQARELTAGTPVAVVLPDGSEVETTLSAVDPGGQPTGDGDATAPPTAVIEFPDQTEVAAAGPVAVRVVIRDEEERPESLVLPVVALLATADGGYAVEVWDGEGLTRIPIEIGMVADARVQVLRSGSEIDGEDGPVLAEGDLVVLAR